VSTPLSIEQVAEFLRSHPEFFESHPDVLLNIEVPHPHGGRTVSIPERQLIATREKVKLLESKLVELIGFGEQNDALSQKVHALTLRLLHTDSLESAIDTLYLDLLDHFQIPHVALRFWNVVVPEGSTAPEFKPVAPELIQFAEAMTAPYCGAHSVYETAAWFGEHAAHLKSFAMVALKTDRTFGLMLFASESAERFYAGMGTLFLNRVGEVFAHLIARHLVPAVVPSVPDVPTTAA
jgi:uncharacterized protein YigA (DUF484 family)